MSANDPATSRRKLFRRFFLSNIFWPFREVCPNSCDGINGTLVISGGWVMVLSGCLSPLFPSTIEFFILRVAYKMYLIVSSAQVLIYFYATMLTNRKGRGVDMEKVVGIFDAFSATCLEVPTLSGRSGDRIPRADESCPSIQYKFGCFFGRSLATTSSIEETCKGCDIIFKYRYKPLPAPIYRTTLELEHSLEACGVA